MCTFANKTNNLMRMKTVLLCLAVVFTLTACGNKKTDKGEETLDSAAVEEKVLLEQQEETPMPMFLYYMNPDYMQVVYWTDFEEPKKTDDNAEYFDQMHLNWAQQDVIRRHAEGYTKMLLSDGKIVDIKYVGELLKNPDGEDMYPGELHSRPSIPSPGLQFAFVNPKDAPKRDYNYGELFVILHKDYLDSRKQLKVTYYDVEKPLPQAVVKQMEKKYSMKATRSVLTSKIGDRYTYGCIQFAGEYKNAPKDKNRDYKKALALEVLMNGDKVYPLEVLGYYDEGECTWNADDGGEYFPTGISAAFEGPDGLELCYEHGAPESRTVGIAYVKDDQLVRKEYAVYHSMIDEETPLWKKDVAKLQKLYVADDPHENKYHKLAKYRWIDIDNDNNDELWMRDKDDQHGALFTVNKGEYQLIGVETDKLHASFLQPQNGKGYVRIVGSAGGPSVYTQLFALKKSKVVERFNMLEVEGNIDEASLNGKTISRSEAADYLDRTPDDWDVYIYWRNIEE